LKKFCLSFDLRPAYFYLVVNNMKSFKRIPGFFSLISDEFFYLKMILTSVINKWFCNCRIIIQAEFHWQRALLTELWNKVCRRLCIKYITCTNCVSYSLLQTSIVDMGANIEYFLIINLCSQIYSFVVIANKMWYFQSSALMKTTYRTLLIGVWQNPVRAVG